MAAMAAWLVGVPQLGQVGLVFVGIACTLTIINDNARTRRVVRLSVAPHVEPPAPVRSLRS
jgi:hypothetical protein